MLIKAGTCEGLSSTWAEEDQAGSQGLHQDLGLEVMDLHGRQDLIHGHDYLIQTGSPTDRGGWRVEGWSLFTLNRTSNS